ncbi:TerD family protein [Nocardia sp. NPDC003693]
MRETVQRDVVRVVWNESANRPRTGHRVRIGRSSTRRQSISRIAHPAGQIPGTVPLPGLEPPGAAHNPTVRHVRMGLGWGRSGANGGTRSDAADLDAAALVFAGRTLLDAVYFDRLISGDNAIRHHGSALRSTGAGECEVITADLSRVHPAATAIVFAVTSYHRHTFDTVPNAYCRIMDGVSRAELSFLDLTTTPATGMLVAAVLRTSAGWRLRPIGYPVTATHPLETLPALTKHLT